MIQLKMTLARHNELKSHYRGKATGIHKELENAGFNMKRDWSVGVEKETGDFIFMQAEPKKVKKPVKAKPKVKPKPVFFKKKGKK